MIVFFYKVYNVVKSEFKSTPIQLLVYQSPNNMISQQTFTRKKRSQQQCDTKFKNINLNQILQIEKKEEASNLHKFKTLRIRARKIEDWDDG